MTRREQMLQEFDILAAAELEDLANPQLSESPQPSSAQPAIRAAAPTQSSSGWSWLIAASVLWLVMRAARR